MTEIELPKWAKIEDNTKLIKCPKECSGWMKKVINGIMVCDFCSMKSYETKLEGYWTRKIAEDKRALLIEKHDLTPQDTYFCSFCRVHHVAGSKIGEMHLEHIADKDKLRICSIPNCEQPLTGKQKKYGCNKNCSIYENWKYTCSKCDYFFGLKGDGKVTQRLCYNCLAQTQGATIKDWEDLGLDPTVSEKEVISAVIKLKLSRKMTSDMAAAAERILEHYNREA